MIYSYGILAYTIKDNKPYVLIVQRRDSFAFIDFMLAKNIDITKMTKDEHERLLSYNFHRLFEDMIANRRCTREQYDIYSKFFNDNIKDVRKQIEEFTGTHKAKMWGFPKGRANKGETPYETAEREFFEETTLKCKITKGKRIRDTYIGDNGKEYCAYYYPVKFNKMVFPEKMTLKKGIRKDAISTETADARWLSIEDAKKLIDERKAKILDLLCKVIFISE